jgi:hypothetical protein
MLDASFPAHAATSSVLASSKEYMCVCVCESQSDTEKKKKSARVALITTSINGENFKNHSCRLLEKSSIVFQISYDNYIYSNTSSLTSPGTNDDGA